MIQAGNVYGRSHGRLLWTCFRILKKRSFPPLNMVGFTWKPEMRLSTFAVIIGTVGG